MFCLQLENIKKIIRIYSNILNPRGIWIWTHICFYYLFIVIHFFIGDTNQYMMYLRLTASNGLSKKPNTFQLNMTAWNCFLNNILMNPTQKLWLLSVCFDWQEQSLKFSMTTRLSEEFDNHITICMCYNTQNNSWPYYAHIFYEDLVLIISRTN